MRIGVTPRRPKRAPRELPSAWIGRAPARGELQFTVGGDRRSFSLLRYVDNPTAQDRLRDFLLEAYQTHEREVEQTTTS
jgi:hypothetical protein